MTPQALVARALPAVPASSGERTMMPRLVEWLVGTGRLRDRTIIANEVPWLGRRVDVALLTARGETTAIELKVGGLQRALEQAAYNAASFHRSWIVTSSHPRAEGIGWALELGIGILVIEQDRASVVTLPRTRTPRPGVAARVRSAIRAKGSDA
jgi:hypothetical protein